MKADLEFSRASSEDWSSILTGYGRLVSEGRHGYEYIFLTTTIAQTTYNVNSCKRLRWVG